MGKEVFLNKLELLLSDISAEERYEAMAFYRSYFEDAGEENEASIIAELGSPEKAAEAIKRDLGMVTVTAQNWQEDNSSAQSRQDNPYGSYSESQQAKEEEKRRDRIIAALVVLMGIVTSPAWFGVVAGILGTVFGVSIALIAVTIAMFAVGFVFSGLGITMITGVSAAVGLAFIGAGLIVLAIAILFLLVSTAVFGKLFPWAWKSIHNLWKKLFAKKGAQAV